MVGPWGLDLPADSVAKFEIPTGGSREDTLA